MKLNRRELLKGTLAGFAAGTTALLLRPSGGAVSTLDDWNEEDLSLHTEIPVESLTEEDVHPPARSLEFPAFSITNCGNHPAYWRRPAGWEPKTGEEKLFAMVSEMGGNPIYPGGYALIAGPIEFLEIPGKSTRLFVREYDDVGKMIGAIGFRV